MASCQWHQFSTWTNVDLSWMGFAGTHLRSISQEVFKISICKMILKNTPAALCFTPEIPSRARIIWCKGLYPWLSNIFFITLYSLVPGISGCNFNKANLRDLIAVTGRVILLKLDPNHRFFSLCDLEIWWMTSKNNRAPLLYYVKLCASFQIHRWIQTGGTVWKCSIWVKIVDFLSCVT